MSKYIIDTDDYIFDVDGALIVGFDCNINPATFYNSLDNLEELNSDYINEHFGELQDEAYQAGLNDAWEAARKIIHMPEGELLNIFTECYSAVCTALQVLLKYDAFEAIAKLKAYDNVTPSDRIEVGDEVEWDGDKYAVTYLNYNIETSEITDYDLLAYDGSVVDHVKKCAFTKTGKHYDIQSILEAMRE